MLIDAVNAVLERLATMPASPEVSELSRRAIDCEHVLKTWSVGRATVPFEDREKMAQLVLSLHVAAAKLGAGE